MPASPTLDHGLPPRRHGRRWWIVGMLCAVMGVAAITVVMTAPRLVCWGVDRWRPAHGGEVLIRGCQFSDQVPAGAATAMVVGRCTPAEFRRIWVGASGYWVPGFALADGQHAWGTFAQAPDITWRLDLVNEPSPEGLPIVSARIPTGVAERLLTDVLLDRQVPVTAVRLSKVKLMGEPTAPEQLRFHLQLSGAATVEIGRSPLAVTLENLIAQVAVRVIPSATDQRLEAAFTIDDLQGEVPFLGSLTPFADTLEKQVNQRLGQELPRALVPVWWPAATRWDLQVTPRVVTEY